MQKSRAKWKSGGETRSPHFRFAWNMSGTPEGCRRKIEALTDHCRKIGRDPNTIEKSVLIPTPLDSSNIRQQIESYLAAGMTHVLSTLIQPYDHHALRRFAQEVMPTFRQDALPGQRAEAYSSPRLVPLHPHSASHGVVSCQVHLSKPLIIRQGVLLPAGRAGGDTLMIVRLPACHTRLRLRPRLLARLREKPGCGGNRACPRRRASLALGGRMPYDAAVCVRLSLHARAQRGGPVIVLDRHGLRKGGRDGTA